MQSGSTLKIDEDGDWTRPRKCAPPVDGGNVIRLDAAAHRAAARELVRGERHIAERIAANPAHPLSLFVRRELDRRQPLRADDRRGS